MTISEAIVARHSVRRYIDKPIDPVTVAKLREIIDQCNREGWLNIQLVTDEPKAFAGPLAKYGAFTGVSNYLVLPGRKGQEEQLGYYGEQVVLTAQTLGLNSCWVGLTYRKQPDHYTLAEGERLMCVIALGYGATQGVQHPQRKGFDDVARIKTGGGSCPEWFRKGVEAALLAPTAVNQQKFVFTLTDNNIVEAAKTFSLMGYTSVDLGIAKCHFEIAAGKDNFRWK